MKAFISYSRERSADAGYLGTALRSRNFDLFLDQESIHPGEDWDEAIRRGLQRSQVLVILFDPRVADEHRYFAIELEEVEKRLLARDVLVLVVLFGPDAAAALPAKLARFQAVVVDDAPREKWVGRVLEAATRFRSERQHLRLVRSGLAGAAAVIVLLGLVVLGLRLRSGQDRAMGNNCVQSTIGADTYALADFAAGSEKLWLVGQSLWDWLGTERGLFLERRGDEPEVRLLLMARQVAGTANPAIEGMSDWDSPLYRDHLDVAHKEVVALLGKAKEKEPAYLLEARTKPLIPFSAIVVDWHREDDAKLQYLPKLYQTPGGERPIFEFSRACDPPAFDAVIDSLKAAWQDAAPVEPSAQAELLH